MTGPGPGPGSAGRGVGGTSIPDFDVEPAVGPRFLPRVLGVVSAVTGALAVIGWPVPVVSRHARSEHAWERTVQGVQDWLAHDGWRASGSSWLYGAASVAALAGAITLLHPGWTDARKLAVVVGTAGVLLVVGLAVQWALGLPWSNYGQA